MNNTDLINSKLQALTKSRFRRKFHLGETEQKIVEEKGLKTIRNHATSLISKRLAPANPFRDGKQTPYKGHPVFIAQHATATCCRNCLFKWHNIKKGRELTSEEKEYVVDVILMWIKNNLRN